MTAAAFPKTPPFCRAFIMDVLASVEARAPPKGAKRGIQKMGAKAFLPSPPRARHTCEELSCFRHLHVNGLRGNVAPETCAKARGFRRLYADGSENAAPELRGSTHFPQCRCCSYGLRRKRGRISRRPRKLAKIAPRRKVRISRPLPAASARRSPGREDAFQQRAAPQKPRARRRREPLFQPLQKEAAHAPLTQRKQHFLIVAKGADLTRPRR